MTDYTELKRLAEAATPGRNYDRVPEAGGGLKYECTGDDGSLVLKVDHKNDEWGFVGDRGEQDEAFFLACTPAAILALIAENEQFRVDRANAMDDACLIAGERDQLKAEVEALRAQLSKSPSVGFDWDAEATAMRKDAGRYRWLNSQRSKVWKEIADVPMNETDQFIDAAMSKETGHD